LTHQVYADGFDPKEVEFFVSEERPTAINVTLSKASVGSNLKKKMNLL
jgi:hypothetical protein